MSGFPKLAAYKSVTAFKDRLQALGLEFPVDETILTAAAGSPLAQLMPLPTGALTLGNRWCVHPMEGWDALPDGNPSPLTLRRWERFGSSGAKLIWGGEAAAVVAEGRANPSQLLATPAHRAGLASLLKALRASHTSAMGSTQGLVVGLQLTHSGRYSRPLGKAAPQIAWHHPLLDARMGLTRSDRQVVLSDGELEALTEAYLKAAGVAQEVGFDFVDIKACHGYLLHELLGARERPGPYGGSLAGRSHLLRQIVRGIRQNYPQLLVGVRLSAGDTVPFCQGVSHGEPEPHLQYLPYVWGFGVDPLQPVCFELSETRQLLAMLVSEGVSLLNVSAGSAYYNPHILRPAAFPPSDGYLPPEDPLVGVARHLTLTQSCKLAAPQAVVVGSGFSYLQEYLPHVAQAVVRSGWMDCVGLGRMMLSYPALPRDTLEQGKLARKLICRTFSDCTTAPRNGLQSGCYPLDPFYAALPEADTVRKLRPGQEDLPTTVRPEL